MVGKSVMVKSFCVSMAFVVVGLIVSASAGQSQEIRVYTNSDYNVVNSLSAFINEELPDGVEVKFIRTPLSQGVRDAVAKGEYDVVMSAAMEGFIREDTLLPLDNHIARDLDLDELDDLLNSMMVRGRLYDIPVSMSPWIVMYNRDLFDAKGIEYPRSNWTWRELQEKAAALTEDLSSGERIHGLLAYSGLWETIVWSMGQGFATLSHTDLDATYSLWTDMAFHDESVVFETGERTLLFANERAAMQITHMNQAFWEANAVRGRTINWGVAPLPRFSELKSMTPVYPLVSIGISRATQHQDEAWEVVKLLLQPDVHRYWVLNGFLPAVLSDDVVERWVRVKTTQERKVVPGLDSWAQGTLFLPGRANLEAEGKITSEVYVQTGKLLNGEINLINALENVKGFIEMERTE